MRSGRPKVKREEVIHYIPGFEEFFRNASDILLQMVQTPRADVYMQTPTPWEMDIVNRATSLISQGGVTPIDRYIQSQLSWGTPLSYTTMFGWSPSDYLSFSWEDYWRQMAPPPTPAPEEEGTGGGVPSSSEELYEALTELEKEKQKWREQVINYLQEDLPNWVSVRGLLESGSLLPVPASYIARLQDIETYRRAAEELGLPPSFAEEMQREVEQSLNELFSSYDF